MKATGKHENKALLWEQQSNFQENHIAVPTAPSTYKYGYAYAYGK